MAIKFIRSKVKMYPRPHDEGHSWTMGLEGTPDSTIYPFLLYDEGLGAPSAYNANPEHASFFQPILIMIAFSIILLINFF